MTNAPGSDTGLRHHIGQVTAARRWGTEQDVIEAKRALHEARMRVAIQREIDRWPPLTNEQRNRLAALLSPVSSDAQAA